MTSEQTPLPSTLTVEQLRTKLGIDELSPADTGNIPIVVLDDFSTESLGIPHGDLVCQVLSPAFPASHIQKVQFTEDVYIENSLPPHFNPGDTSEEQFALDRWHGNITRYIRAFEQIDQQLLTSSPTVFVTATDYRFHVKELPQNHPLYADWKQHEISMRSKLYDCMNRLRAKGGVFVCASGNFPSYGNSTRHIGFKTLGSNDGEFSVLSPQEGVIVVSGIELIPDPTIDEQGQKRNQYIWARIGHGELADITALGTLPFGSGCSIAAPLVAIATAMILKIKPELMDFPAGKRENEIIRLLQKSSIPLIGIEYTERVDIEDEHFEPGQTHHFVSYYPDLSDRSDRSDLPVLSTLSFRELKKNLQ